MLGISGRHLPAPSSMSVLTLTTIGTICANRASPCALTLRPPAPIALAQRASGPRRAEVQAAHAAPEDHRPRGARCHQPRDGSRSRAGHCSLLRAMNAVPGTTRPTPSDRPPMRTLSLSDAAALLRMHPEEVRRRAKRGTIPGAKPGRCWVFIEDDLAEYVRSTLHLCKRCK